MTKRIEMEIKRIIKANKGFQINKIQIEMLYGYRVYYYYNGEHYGYDLKEDERWMF